MRKPISVEQKLAAITIRYLAIRYQFRVHETTISKFIPEVCKAILKA